KGKKFIETELYNGEYFYQKIQVEGLNAPNPIQASEKSMGGHYSDEARALLEKEGPKYQYGTGCLSDGVLGAWMTKVSGLNDPFDSTKIQSHLTAVHKYNFKNDLSEHANPQRPSFALGNEGGLLLCSWPKGGKLSLPFVYSDEVWTGIEYQVASHLIFMGKVNEGIDIVRACRDRYDGKVRNPFNEYECGHWYARALSSYGLLQSLTGVRFDAVDKILYVDSKVGDFTSFLSTETGFGTVKLANGKVSVNATYGNIPVNKINLSGKVSEYKV
ncbi:MAG TPA: GH116 family glycosyl hydrolase, partial [Chryseolinea sp.]|nr:GH116 family glycosyl hydrolase [Chryseolinea sp.]